MSIENGKGVTADEPLKREDLHPLVAQPKELEESKMENNGGQRDLWTYLLLLNGGVGGFGRGGYGGYGGGYGPHAGGGPSIADETAVHTLKLPTCADLNAASASTEGRITDLGRDLATFNRENQDSIRNLQLQASQMNADMRSELAACCCETQKEVLNSRFTTELGFKDMTAQLCDVKTALSAQIAETERARLAQELGDCKAALATANQTTVLSGIVGSAVASGVQQVTSQCCCNPCDNGNGGHGRGGGGGGGGVSAVDIQNIVLQTMAMAGGNGFTPPGQGGKK